MLKKSISIGRAKDNDCILSYPKVSSHHCKITEVEGGLLLEDPGSANGTFVNGRQVRQMLIQDSDSISVADCQIDIKVILSVFDSSDISGPLSYEEIQKLYTQAEKQRKIYEEFRLLQNVYTEYIARKKRIVQGNTWKSTGIRAGLSLIPVVGNTLATIASTASNNTQVKMIDLEEQFKKDYICPGCLKFLGSEPFENLYKRKSCHYCKVQWVPDDENL